MVDDQEQVVKSQAPIAEFSGDPGKTFALVDLSTTYAGQLASAKRRFTVQPDHRVIIEDELKGGTNAATVRWGMVTPGTLKKERAQAGWLEKNGKRLRMDVAAPANVSVTLQTWSAAPPHDFDEPNPGVSIVSFTVPVAAGQQVLVKVILTPGSVVGAGK
jgi:hypothetical protein